MIYHCLLLSFLSSSLSDVNVAFSKRMQNNKKWHLEAIQPQATEEKEKFGLPPARPKKVKMKPGATPSEPRVPVDHIEPLTAEALEQRRDYAHFLWRARALNLEKRHQSAVQGLFLPYVNNKQGLKQSKAL